MKDRFGEELNMICLNCNHFDFNDCVHGFGTCESLDADFKAYHECTCPKSELLLIEKLQKERREKDAKMFK